MFFVLNINAQVSYETYSTDPFASTVMGKHVLTVRPNNNELNTSLPSGIYIMKTIYKDGTSISKKIIK